jgi:predicted nuclease with TOPRIM domain
MSETQSVFYNLKAHYDGMKNLCEEQYKDIKKLKVENEKLKAALEESKNNMRKVSEMLDGIQYELCSRIYTVDDDNFGFVFTARDLLHIYAKELEEILK